MASWVRYSVAAYLGLLLSGTVLSPPPAPIWAPDLRIVKAAPDPGDRALDERTEAPDQRTNRTARDPMRQG